MPRAGDDLVHLEAGQLSAFSGLRSLCHLDLYLFGIHQVGSRHAEASGSHLLGLAAQRDAVVCSPEAGFILAAFSRVAACPQLVHGECQRLVCLLADGAERDGSRDEVLHDALHWFHLVNGDGVALEAEEVAEEEGLFLPVCLRGELLELRVAPQPGRQLELADGLRVPGMPFPVLAVGELADVRQQVGVTVFPVGKSCPVEGCIVAGDLLQTDASDGRGSRPEAGPQQFRAHPDGFEYLRAPVGADGADAHLAHDFVQSLADRLDVVLLRRLVVHLHLAPFHPVIEHGERHVRVEGAGTVAQQQGGMHHFADFPALDNQRRLHTLLHADQVVMHGTDG